MRRKRLRKPSHEGNPPEEETGLKWIGSALAFFHFVCNACLDFNLTSLYGGTLRVLKKSPHEETNLNQSLRCLKHLELQTRQIGLKTGMAGKKSIFPRLRMD